MATREGVLRVRTEQDKIDQLIAQLPPPSSTEELIEQLEIRQSAMFLEVLIRVVEYHPGVIHAT